MKKVWPLPSNLSIVDKNDAEYIVEQACKYGYTRVQDLWDAFHKYERTYQQNQLYVSDGRAYCGNSIAKYLLNECNKVGKLKRLERQRDSLFKDICKKSYLITVTPRLKISLFWN